MRVYLTGGTGLLGSHLAEELIRNGHEVVALHRAEADIGFLQELGCELVEGDVREEASDLARGMSGCTHVVHGVALVYSSGNWPLIRSINVDGTRNVLGAASDTGVEHAVHISSVAAYGTVDGPVDESHPIDGPIPHGDLYARSKREAEEVATGIGAKRGLSTTIVRPSAVYGERDRLTAPGVADLLRLPIVPLLGPGDNSLPIVYAGNVAVAIRLMLEAAEGGAVYDVGMDHPLTQRTLFTELAAGLGREPTFVSVPAGLIRSGGEILTRVGVHPPGAKHLPMNRLTRLALGENPYPSRAVQAKLGWNPPHQHAEALRRTGEWLLSQKRRKR